MIKKDKIKNCMDCKFHCVKPDIEPNIFADSGKVMVVCTKDKKNFEIGVRLDPLTARLHCKKPLWCPL